MFCPTCGKDNPSERKFCSSCGTNLAAISEVLSGNTTNFFTRLDAGLDYFIARYSEHVFKNAPAEAVDRSVAHSWKLLGRGVLTSFVDIFLALLIWNVFTFRFQVLWISTPFRLLAERGKRQEDARDRMVESPPRLEGPAENRWLPGAVPSVSEHTTETLREYLPPRRDPTSPQD